MTLLSMTNYVKELYHSSMVFIIAKMNCHSTVVDYKCPVVGQYILTKCPNILVDITNAII